MDKEIKLSDVYTTLAMKGSPLDNEIQEMVKNGQLEKKTGIIALTVPEFEEIIKEIASDAFTAGRNNGVMLMPTPNKEQYLANLIK